jgi:hypothetical protein
MYEYIDSQTETVGAFNTDKHKDFKDGFKYLVESMTNVAQVNPISDLGKILNIDVLKENYKELLLNDVLNENFDDPYYASIPAKMEQLFENSAYDILRESSAIGQLAPIVGISLPILKKNFIEGHAKDIVMTEVPTKPIVKVAFERKFFKDKAGEKYYIPDIFWDDTYKRVVDVASGKAIDDKWFTVPQMDLPILNLSGGSLEARDSLGYDFCIKAVKIEVPGEDADPVLKTIDGLNVQPDFGSNNNFSAKITALGDDTPATTVVDVISGTVDQYAGKVTVACAAGKIKSVQFGGRLSNENNVDSVELDRERQVLEWKIGDGKPRINTGLTIERIKDYKALFDIDITTEIISDMSRTITDFEDSSVLTFLDDSLAKWKTKKDLPFGYKNGFVESAEFSCVPPPNTLQTPSMWINTELKFNLNRLIDELKDKLRTSDLMFVVYGHPINVSLIQDDVKWVIDEDDKIGGVQLDYSFGVFTGNKNRIHVISSMKVNKDKGLRVVAYPLSKETITFKHYKYSMNIENVYRNPQTPNIPNIMGVSRYITTEVLPVQGEFILTGNTFGIRAPK